MKTPREVALQLKPNRPSLPCPGSLARGVAPGSRLIAIAAIAIGVFAQSVWAQTTVYWDVNGSSTGATNSTVATGTWAQSSGSTWTTNSAGTSSTNTWANRVTSGTGGRARFAAGTNATGTYTVTVSGDIGNNGGTDNLYAINFDNGAVTFGGSGTLHLQTGGITIASTNANTQTISAKVVLAADQTWDTATSALAVSGIISGSGDLTKTGTGTLTLSGANTYTGDTTVSAGTLLLASSNVIADASNLSIASGAQVTLNGSSTETVGSLSGTGTLFLQSGTFTTNTTANTTFSGAITDYYGNFRKAGTGDLTLSGASTFGGTTSVDGGTLLVTNSSALGGTTYGNEVASGATLALQGGITVNEGSFNLVGNGEGGLGAIENRSGTNTLDGQLNINGATTISSTSGSLTLTGQVVTGTNTVTFNGAGNITSTNQISGTGNITKLGSGNLTLTGTNTHSGATTVSTGTLTVANSSALGTTAGGTTVASGATLALTNNVAIGTEAIANSGTVTNTSGSNSYAGVLSGTGNLTTTAGTLTLSGANTFSGNVTVGSGSTLVATHSNALGSGGGTTTVQSGGTLELQNDVYITSESSISFAGTGNGGGGALRNTSGTNTIKTNINLTGATTLTSTGGTLQLGDPALAAWPIQGTLAMGANDLTFNTAGGDIFLRLTLTGSGNVIKTGANTLTVRNGFNDGSSGNFLINDGTLILDTFNNENLGIMGNVTVGDGIGAAGSARFQQGTTESGVGLASNLIKDTSNITINSDGHWDLQGYKEIVNNVTMNGGTIEAKNNSGTGDRLDIIGTLTTNTSNLSTIDGRLGLNNDTAKSIAVNTGSTLDINAIVSNGGFIKSGTGTMILSGANSFTGNAVVSAGILNVDNNSGLGATAGYTQVNNNAQLQLSQVSIGTEQLFLNGSGISSTGALRSMAGTTNVWGGSVSLQTNSEIETASGSSLTVNGSITGSGKTLTVESIGNTTFNGNNTFNTLNKTGAGTLTVTGINTYATTNVNAGTYTIGNSNILSDLMDINVAAGATFNVGNHAETIDDLAGSGTVRVGSTGALTIDNLGNGSAFTGTLDIDGIMTLNGGIIGGGTGVDSSGTMVLTAGNSLQIATSYTFGGTLQLNAGTTLNLAGAGTTFTLDTLHITGNTVIDFAGSNIATFNIGHLIIDPGVAVSATGWTSFYDLWTAATFTGATLDNRNGTTAQITFNGFSASDTIWKTYDYGANEITVPEPSSYGALLTAFALGAYGLRRKKRPA